MKYYTQREKRELFREQKENPPYRKLRGYALDPSISRRLDTNQINEIVYKVPWERLVHFENPGHPDEPAGFQGEYIKVIDYLHSEKRHYEPVNLDDPYLMAQDGMDPSESDPRFHQQMVYAVVMTTIANFENAIGRKVMWSPIKNPETGEKEFNQWLRVYPHGLGGKDDAEFDPEKNALNFGYFRAESGEDGGGLHNSMVFTCLDHDIITNTTMKAILFGMFGFSIERELKSDIVLIESISHLMALFQRFTFPELLQYEIARTQGDLGKKSLMSQLAPGFGVALGIRDSFMDVLGEMVEDPNDETVRVWKQRVPHPTDLPQATTVFDRSKVFLSAVFEVFLQMYQKKVADLLRIATSGSGKLPDGAIHPDLVNRLAEEAARVAERVLSMSIRALDYCPPVDIELGDYLRGVITADLDLAREDGYAYRIAFIDAFVKRGVCPKGIDLLSVDSLRYPEVSFEGLPYKESLWDILTQFLSNYGFDLAYEEERSEIYRASKNYIEGKDPEGRVMNSGLRKQIKSKFGNRGYFEKLTGLIFKEPDTQGVVPFPEGIERYFEVENLRVVANEWADGNRVNYIVFSLVQSVRWYWNGAEFVPENSNAGEYGEEVWGGCTFMVDLTNQKLKYAISSPLLIPNEGPGKAMRFNEKMAFGQIERYGSEEMPQQEEALPKNGSEPGITTGNIFVSPTLKTPAFRKLRGYAFDPSLSTQLDVAHINEIIYKVPWEPLGLKEHPRTGNGVGPVGEYLEVVDYDPTVDKYYKAVDLNEPNIMAQDGLSPSESNPQFHQQMVYAVAMTTIHNFEKALGRKVFWSTRLLNDRNQFEEYVQRLRIYPHALRDANAYYSPLKKALLFGYFTAQPADSSVLMPDSLVFNCLSHDVIAHETTHAILDGLFRHYNEPTNPDVLAFHEAFSDIVALFQHFSFPDVLKHQIAQTRGDLESQNLLGQLAQQFGKATGNYGSLRDYIGRVDPITQKWIPHQPSPNEYQEVTESHARGSILVAAVFEAFLNIYKRRVRDLLRLASSGTGVLPEGELHPDLVNRLADTASTTASHILSMCIRALDYCPPVDITFGDFLRAIITADMDVVKDDPRNYRLAFIEAFRRRGIYPEGIKSLSLDSLQIPRVGRLEIESEILWSILANFLRKYRQDVGNLTNRREIWERTRDYIVGNNTADEENGTHPGLHEMVHQGLTDRLNVKFAGSLDPTHNFERLTGLVFHREDLGNYGVKISSTTGQPSFQIQNLRVVNRVGPDGDKVNQIIFSIVQRSWVIMEDGLFSHFYNSNTFNEGTDINYELKGGCTLIVDLASLTLKYAIAKPLLIPKAPGDPRDKDLVFNAEAAERQFQYIYEDSPLAMTDYNQYFGKSGENSIGEPFAFLHQHYNHEH